MSASHPLAQAIPRRCAAWIGIPPTSRRSHRHCLHLTLPCRCAKLADELRPEVKQMSAPFSLSLASAGSYASPPGLCRKLSPPLRPIESYATSPPSCHLRSSKALGECDVVSPTFPCRSCANRTTETQTRTTPAKLAD